jgi:hypothetical protein
MRSRAVSRLVVSLVCLPLLAAVPACGKDEPAKPKSTPVAPEPISSEVVYNSFFDDPSQKQPSVVMVDSGAAATDTTPLGPAGKAKVLEPGAEPRARLSYAFAMGKTRTVTNTITLAVAADQPGGGQQPPIKYVFTVTPKTHNAANNSTHFELKVSSLELLIPAGANVPPEIAAQKKAMESSIVGLTGSFDANSQGDIDAIKFADEKIPQQAAELLQVVAASFDIMLVPLPSDPVGIGAKWQSVLTKLGKGSSTATVSLISKNETGATVKIESTVSTPPTAVNDPRIPAGTTVEVKGSGSYTVDLKFDGVAARATGNQTVDRIIKVPAQGQGGQAQTETDTQKIAQDLSSK